MAAFVSALKDRGVLIRALLMLLLGIWLARVPLFNVLGYESAVAVSALLYVCASLNALFFLRRLSAQEAPGDGPRQTWGAVWLSLLISLIHWLLPLIALTINAARVTNCHYAKGLGLFTIIPLPAALFSIGLTILLYRWTRSPGFKGHGSRFNQSGNRAVLLVWLYAVLSLVTWGITVYLEPRLNWFGLIAGEFVLPNYSRKVYVGLPMLLSRASVIAAALFFINAAILFKVNAVEALSLSAFRDNLKKRMGSAALLAVLIFLAIPVALFMTRGHYGVNPTLGYIRSVLSETYRSEYCVIHYEPETRTAKQIEEVALEHDFLAETIAEDLGLERPPLLHSYVYKSGKLKYTLTGSNEGVVAFPWRQEMHLIHNGGEVRSLRHEMTHAMASRISGIPPTGTGWTAGITEGLAVALERPEANVTLHQQVAGFRRLKHFPDIDDAMRAYLGFFNHETHKTYQVCGSFTRWLLQTYGKEKIVKLYRTNHYEEIYGKPFSELKDEWLAFLDTVDISPELREYMESAYKRKPFTRVKCAHTVEELWEEARSLHRSRKFDLAHEAYTKLIRINPDDPRYFYYRLLNRIDEGNLEAARGLLAEFSDHDAADFYWLSNSWFRLARLELQLGDNAAAGLSLEKADALAVDPVLVRQIEIFKRIGEYADPETVRTLSHALSISDAKKREAEIKGVLEKQPEDGFLNLLMGRGYCLRGNYKAALDPLKTGLSSADVSEDLHSESGLMYAQALMQLGRLDEARLEFGRIAASDPIPARREMAEYLIRRCDFVSQREGGAEETG